MIQTVKYSLDNSTLDNLLEGFQLVSFDWTYLYINDAAAKHGKSSKKNLIGYTMMEKYPGIENTDMFRTLQRCMKERVSERMENEFTNPDGTSGWFELRIEPVPEGLFILSLDITEKKNAEKKLVELNESLEQTVLLRTAELVEKNKEMTDSIHYAKRIQRAKFPDKKNIYEAFPQSFILFKPKDIVSGDFYYFHKKDDENVTIASVDCTGHGIPGALMSMIGFEKLDEALTHSSDPSKILSFLNKKVKSSFKQSDKYEPTRDGMDISICTVNTKTYVVKYAGANQPLWVVRDGHNIVEEIKGTKQAIGGFTADDQYYDTHEIPLKQGDTFYLFSDGYADSFGGKKNKKLKTKRFKEILLSIQHKPMPEQKIHLDHFIEEWKAELEQIDDILVIGIQL